MPTVGEQLRQAREEQKLSFTHVADLTKIRSDHLRALEEGNYSIFSAPVYIRGFVRTYSNLLRLDTARIIEQLGHELAESGQVDPSLTPKSRGVLDAVMYQLSKISGRFVLMAIGGIGLVVVALVGYVVWDHVHTADPTENMGDGFYQSPTNSGETLAIPAPR